MLSFEDQNDASTAFEASRLEHVVVDGRRYVSVVVPGALLAAGRWELLLTGDPPAAERLRYALIVE